MHSDRGGVCCFGIVFLFLPSSSPFCCCGRPQHKLDLENSGLTWVEWTNPLPYGLGTLIEDHRPTWTYSYAYAYYKFLVFGPGN